MSSQQAAQVLLTGENSELLTTLSRILTLEGYKTHTESENEVLPQLLAAVKPQAVILDVFLFPSKTVRTISVIRKYSQAPLLVLAGEYEANELRNTPGTEPFEHVAKPFRMKELLDRIDTIVHSSPK